MRTGDRGNKVEAALKFYDERVKPPKHTYWLGKTQPPEMVEKRRQKMIGKPSGNKGTVLSEETKQRISEHNARYWRGKHHSEETKNKMREKRASQDMSYRHSAYTLLSPEGKEVAFQSVKEILQMLKIQDGGYFYRLVSGNLAELNGWKFVRKGAVNGNNQVSPGHGSLQDNDDAVSSPQVP